jgi:aldehyde:ferredoxin oxidoreductase
VNVVPHGYRGKVLRVNLSRESIKIEEPDDVYYRRYFGGRAVIAYHLLHELQKGIDPLGSKNKLIFATGVIDGTPISGTGRNSIGAKSPLTGAYGDGQVGGFWQAELKRAGWDTIIVEGCAKDPVYLWIKDDDVEIRDASQYWGKDTGEVVEALREEAADKHLRVSLIGRGGENLVRYACIMNGGKDAAGRTGMGAVMGSKKLKAIAVRGTGKVDIMDLPVLTTLSKKLAGMMPGFWAHEWGTGGFLDGGAFSGNLPYHNFRDGNYPYYDEISGYALHETGLRVGMEGCWACLVKCKKIVKVDGPEYHVDPYYGGPEYETLGALGSCCGIGDLPAICKGNELCNRHSLDTISCGVTIAFAMECYENGLLTTKDTGGLDLKFGNVDAMVKLVDMIGKREGFGDVLADGVQRVAERIGKNAGQFAVHVKGQELPMHEPRLKRGLGIGYALSPTGADHQHNLHDTGTVSEDGIARFKVFGLLEPVPLEDMGPKKVRLLLYELNWQHMKDCLHMCHFLPWTPRELVNITDAVTGWKTSVFELSKIGERAINLTRIFNIREGFTVHDDTLPERAYHPHTSGSLSKTAINREALQKAVQTYYTMMGWNPEGVPRRETLEELGIDWAYNYLP